MILLCLTILLVIPALGQSKSLDTVFAWKTLDFGFSNLEEINFATQRAQLIPQNADPFDVDVVYYLNGERRVFVTIPRLKEGIPYTLATVEVPDGDLTRSRLRPYPNYHFHASNGNDCYGITSAVRAAIDQYNRLWILDSGKIGSKSFCPPQILVFDLKTDALIHCHRIPEGLYRKDASRLMNMIVDISDPLPNQCSSKTVVFIADTGFHGLIIYDVENNGTWRAENKLMFPDPDFGTISIAGERANIMDGILGLSVTPQYFEGERFLYFNTLSGDTQSAVSLRMLMNRTIWDNGLKAVPVNTVPREFIPLGRRGVQCTTQAMDSRGNIYCVTMDEVTLFSWNIQTPYEEQQFKILANDQEQLQFASGVKVIWNSRGEEELWILTTRHQKTLTGSRNFDEINFRILVCSIENLNSLENACGVQGVWR